MGLRPQLPGNAGRLDSGSRPPIHFLTGAVQFAVMRAAKRDRELVTDFLSETAGLREPQMMGSQGCRPQIRQGCLATNRRWVLSRSRRGAGMASRLLSMRPIVICA